MSWWSALLVAVTGAAWARRPGAREAEQLVRGEPVPADLCGLAELLAAASAPATAEEQAGLDAACEAFVRTRHQWPPAGPQSRPARRIGRLPLPTWLGSSRTGGSRVVALKLGATALAMALAATAATAAAGRLPAPAQHSVHDLLAAVGLPVPDAAHQSDEQPPADPFHPSPSAPHPAPSSTPATAVPPATLGLCQTYLSGKKPGKGMAAADLDRLATAAGGPAGIETYCTRLLAGPSPAPTPTPTTSSNGNGNAYGKQDCHGNGRKACPTPTG